MQNKQLLWIGSSRSDLRAFPAEARRSAGFQLRRVQLGEDPNDWKPMPTIGPGVREVRIHVEGEHRVFYIATFKEAVYVLHAFQKKIQRTAASDLKLGRERFTTLTKMRQRRHGTPKPE